VHLSLIDPTTLTSHNRFPVGLALRPYTYKLLSQLIGHLCVGVDEYTHRTIK
jgi:hypothetical protein